MPIPRNRRTYGPVPATASQHHWRDDATCRDVLDPDIFFPERGQSIAPAQTYCRRCPVVARCLEEAIETGAAGVRGGVSEATHAEMGRRRRRERRDAA